MGGHNTNCFINQYCVPGILDGDLIVGFSLFFLVPLLGVVMVLYFLWFRRQRVPKSFGT
jgi:hypothetical protein